MKATIINENPEIVEMKDDEEIFGNIEELTSRDFGAKRSNLARVMLWGPDFIHEHKNAEETYVCEEGRGEIFLDGQIFIFNPGVRVIIPPGTLHAVRPQKPFPRVTFLCISSPAFDPIDQFSLPDRNW